MITGLGKGEGMKIEKGEGCLRIHDDLDEDELAGFKDCDPLVRLAYRGVIEVSGRRAVFTFRLGERHALFKEAVVTMIRQPLWPEISRVGKKAAGYKRYLRTMIEAASVECAWAGCANFDDCSAAVKKIRRQSGHKAGGWFGFSCVNCPHYQDAEYMERSDPYGCQWEAVTEMIVSGP
jgi:hypothetical protein